MHHFFSLLSSIRVDSVKKRNMYLALRVDSYGVSLTQQFQLVTLTPSGQMCNHSFPLKCVGVKSLQVASVNRKCLFGQRVLSICSLNLFQKH